MLRKLLALFVLLFAVPSIANAAQRIVDYTIHIELRADGVSTVQEEILYDFGTEQRHGIIRDIPLITKMPDGAEREIILTNLSVTGLNGKEHPFDVSGGGNFTEIKIGNPNMMVRGEVLYVIRYDVVGAVRSLPDAKEFFWNAVGNDWDVPIQRVRLQVALPRTLSENEVAFACFSGFSNNVTPCESGIADGSIPGSVTMLRFLATNLAPKAGMSIAVAVPPESITITDIPKKSAQTLGGNLWWKDPKVGASILIPILVFLAMLYRWKIYGKDPEELHALVHEYDPPEDIDAAMAGYILRERVSDTDISASVLSLAGRGYLSIEIPDVPSRLRTSTTMILHRLRPKSTEKLTAWDEILLDVLFPGNISVANSEEIAQRFRSANISSLVAKEIENEVLRRGYYDTSPSRIRGTYILAGFALFILGIFLDDAALTPSFIATALIIGIIGWFMPKPTERGARVRDAVLGYKEYLNIAEKERIRFHTDDSLNQSAYEKILPYALAFGMGSAWIARFTDFYEADEHPTWVMSGQNAHPNSSLASERLAGAIASLTQTISVSSATRASGSGGTGRVGGGFGGGGGRSW